MRWRPAQSAGPLAVVGSNLVAPVGLLAFGWSTTVLLGVFLFELVAVMIWTVVKIPFAAKRPNNALGDDRLLGPFQAKRGAIGVPGPLPPVYLRNLPTLLVTVCLFVPLETAAALVVFDLADPALTASTADGLLAGGLAVFIGRGVETGVDYFFEGGYRRHSPRSVLLGPFRHLFGVGAIILVVGPFGLEVGSGLLLGCLLAGKLLYDLRTVQLDRDDEARGLFYRLYGSAETEIEPVPVAEPDSEPELTVRPNRVTAITDALYYGVRYTLTSRVLAVYAVGVFLFVVAPTRLVAVPTVVVAGFMTFRSLGRYLRYGAVEYRYYPEDIVAYDRLLDEPQGRLGRGDVTALSLETDPVDRLFRTETIRFETGADTGSRVGLFVPDPEEIEGDDANANQQLSVPHVERVGPIVDAVGLRWLAERDVPDAVEP